MRQKTALNQYCRIHFAFHFTLQSCHIAQHRARNPAPVSPLNTWLKTCGHGCTLHFKSSFQQTRLRSPRGPRRVGRGTALRCGRPRLSRLHRVRLTLTLVVKILRNSGHLFEPRNLERDKLATRNHDNFLGRFLTGSWSRRFPGGGVDQNHGRQKLW